MAMQGAAVLGTSIPPFPICSPVNGFTGIGFTRLLHKQGVSFPHFTSTNLADFGEEKKLSVFTLYTCKDKVNLKQKCFVISVATD